MKKKLLKLVARTMLLSMTYQLVFPLCTFALTTGPSQPEVQSFEPVGTTEIVDMFSGDFNYNIPLMDVEGYPINIFYHSGVGMEQEASWVGLGWNINPGEINRTVRGIPDDFNGETIEKTTKIKEEKDIRIGIGANVVTEILGKDLKELGISLSLGASYYVNHNNYRGLSAGFSYSVGIKTPVISTGISLGVGSQAGADIDFNASAAVSNKVDQGTSYGLSAGVGTGFNSRSGLKDVSLSVTPTASEQHKYKDKKGIEQTSKKNGSVDVASTSIPIGMQNYVPVITNQVFQNSYALQLKAGGEMFGTLLSGYVDAMISNISYAGDGSRAAYGYLYSENANRESIRDFSRDKDGSYNETMKNLPLSTNTYDVYSVNGQGTGGMFRPFRNDIGTINDPYVSPGEGSNNFSGLIEAGLGNAFELGGDLTTVNTKNESGPWVNLPYGSSVPGTLYEKVFFKNGGDLSYNQQQEAAQIFNPFPQYLLPDLNRFVSNNYAAAGSLPSKLNGTSIFWNNSIIDRSSRSTHIGFRTEEELEQYAEPDFPSQIMSFENGTGNHFYDPKIKTYARHSKSEASGPKHNDQPFHVGVFTQTLPDGRRYIYDIPAMNNATREVTFSVPENQANLNNGYVGYNSGVDDNTSNTIGRDNYFTQTNTPAYAHSYLLTSVLSNDYVDVLGDGATDDDLGSFTKFNYTLADNDYRWRAPFPKDTAQYNPGFWSDNKDGKGSYIIGSRQQWYIRSVETKNYVAEFYTSKRKDARGIQSAVLLPGSKLNTQNLNLKASKTDSSYSYQLDSIVLYNKHDRYINKDNAVPVKTVIMQYDYSLCKNTVNSYDASKGKLTLKRLFIKYGNSGKNMLSPYVFNYNASNPDYDFAAKDRWGNYKKVVPGIHNYEFPYTVQPDDTAAENAQNAELAAWNLTDVKLPSGGKIHIDYESDDYAWVQDKRAMQELHIAGLGSSQLFMPTNLLYTDKNNINDYVYFKRRKNNERSGLSMKGNYLEGQEMISYNFNIDITGKGNYEYIKGYARFDEVGICSGNSDYGYIRLLRDDAKGMNLHPATIYGINMARYYLPHIFYDGYNEGSDVENIIKGMFSSGKELLGSLVLQNPFKRWTKEKKAKFINIANSSVRVHVPDLAKKGGGIRVKQLSLSDNWNEMTGGQAASYGKKYDYTINDPRYGIISSGVATYEPMIGGEENPFHNPVPYTAEKLRLLPSIYFFQEEPFGESFYPGASVGYSSVKVSSIHQEYGRSAQALDEYLFYTAKDFPVKVHYTQLAGSNEAAKRTLFTYYKESEVMQGYSVVLNDMHGKPKAVNNYTIHQDGSETILKRITGVQYYYFTGQDGKSLDNKVDALMRRRGTQDTYDLKKIILGQDVDVSIDSRLRNTENYMTKTNLNLNVFFIGIFPIFPFTEFHIEKEKTINFKSLVTTKIIQQYGILKSIESFDHDALTKTENLVFDAETGGVLLSRTNNQYNDFVYNRKDPAYLSYEGMMPAYTNMDYEETADSLVIDASRDGYLYTTNMDRFSPGDELLVKLIDNSKKIRFGDNPYVKLWVLKNVGGRTCYPSSLLHNVAFWKPLHALCSCPEGRSFGTVTGSVHVSIYASSAPTVLVASGNLNSFFSNSGSKDYPTCADSSNYLPFKLPVGNYNYTLSGAGIPPLGSYSGTFTVAYNSRTGIAMQKCDSGHIANLSITKTCTQSLDSCGKPAGSDSTIPCAFLVAPRYKDAFATGTTTPNISKWPTTATKYTKVAVKVLRSGRRNNLDRTVQETQYAAPASTSSFYSDINSYFGKTDNVIASGVTIFTDSAQNYAPFGDTVNIPFVKKYALFNPFVLGLKGTYRPLASYAPIAKRDYSKVHARYNGTYTMEPFWEFMAPKCFSGCFGDKRVLSHNDSLASPFWKRASLITRYDPNGNALEEQDAIGNYSSAQYAYNRLLPVAVASNARAQHMMFEGFEEYNMLMPQASYLLNNKNSRHSAFAAYFGDPLASIISSYPSEQSSGDADVFTRYGQRYQLINKTPSGANVQITNAESHSGNFSMKCTESKSVNFTIQANDPAHLLPFTLDPAKNYILNLWVKSATSEPLDPSTVSTDISPSSTTGTLSVRSGNIDGWQLLQFNIDLKSLSSPTQLTLNLPANIYIDDLRLLPVESNMKSFVYDPITFKLLAQLDENHFATFFEYDQEGLLVRTKKETQSGIMTINESRRSNAKKN